MAEPEVVQDIEIVAVAEEKAQEPEAIVPETIEEPQPIAVGITSPVHEQNVVEPMGNDSEGGSGKKRMQSEVSGGAS